MSFSLFECYGIEIEYMIVDKQSLDVKPICDRLMKKICGDPELEIERGNMAWSNELALHVLEFKTNGPRADFQEMASSFQEEVRAANEFLSEFDAKLLPTGMHPWMNPDKETKLWPHECGEVYQSFDRIFGCKGHGWSNLQSTHLNLPFSSDEEFKVLHQAVRVLLPLIPALSASSPFADGKLQPYADYRLEVYRHNCKKIPEVTGKMIPENVSSESEYQSEILEPIYEAMKALDPQGILRHEWINARAAISRFDRKAIEIRLIDTQECPKVDLALCHSLVCVLKYLVSTNPEALGLVSTDRLSSLLLGVIKEGRQYLIRDQEFLGVFGLSKSDVSAQDFWRFLHKLCIAQNLSDAENEILKILIEQGSLSERLRAAFQKTGRAPADLTHIYGQLSECLREGKMFL